MLENYLDIDLEIHLSKELKLTLNVLHDTQKNFHLNHRSLQQDSKLPLLWYEVRWVD